MPARVPCLHQNRSRIRVKPSGFSFTTRSQLRHLPPLRTGLGSGSGLQRLEVVVTSCQGQPRGLCQTRHHQLPQQLGFYYSALTKSSLLAAWWQNSQGLSQQHPQQTEPSLPSANCSGRPTVLAQSWPMGTPIARENQPHVCSEQLKPSQKLRQSFFVIPYWFPLGSINLTSFSEPEVPGGI